MRLFDAHNHAHDAWLEPHAAQVDRDLRALGLEAAVVNGTSEADWPAVAAFARRFAWARPSFGLHPWDAGNRSPDWREALRAHLAAEPEAAVGEIGLDRWMLDGARPDDPRLAGLRRAPLEEQREVFLAQLALAKAENRPVTIHCLQAFGALESALRTAEAPSRGFLLHAYSGPAELVPFFAARGGYFSFNGAFLGPRHAARREAFRLVPAERLLVETDAPAMPLPEGRATHALPPTPGGEAINHPANLGAAYAGLAALRDVTMLELAALVERNFRRLFGP